MHCSKEPLRGEFYATSNPFAGLSIFVLKSLKRIRRRSGKSIGAVTQMYLHMLVVDEMDRELEIITPWKGTSSHTLAHKYQ
jgi:hypothetical protein